MKKALCLATLVLFLFTSTGCIGFWTLVGTTIYMKSNKHHTVTVRLKSDPDKIYQAMLKVTEKNGVKIEESDPKTYMVAGLKGERYASCFTKDIGSGMSQLVVTVDVKKNKAHEEFALTIVNNICDEVGEKCELKE